jgi:hypothetical protein
MTQRWVMIGATSWERVVVAGLAEAESAESGVAKTGLAQTKPTRTSPTRTMPTKAIPREPAISNSPGAIEFRFMLAAV